MLEHLIPEHGAVIRAVVRSFAPVSYVGNVSLGNSAVERVEAGLIAFEKGEFVVVLDAAERENEGDLIIAAQFATPEKMAFMIRETTGMICCSITKERADALELPPMVVNNTESHGTAFTVSCDYRHGTTTGVSAGDRALTIKALADENCKASDFNRPGHMFPLVAKRNGVIERPGHTEAAVDLCKLANLTPAAAICEICNRYFLY